MDAWVWLVNIVEEIRIKEDDKWRIMADGQNRFIANSMIQIEEKGALFQTSQTICFDQL